MARYYNPDMGVWVWGVFMSIDPVRGDTMNPITMNGYNYANDNPVINVDSDGEFARFIPVAIGVYRVVKILFDLDKYLKNMRYLSKYVNVTKSWVKQYDYNGVEAFIKPYTNYTIEFKLDVLKFMIENGTSFGSGPTYSLVF